MAGTLTMSGADGNGLGRRLRPHILLFGTVAALLFAGTIGWGVLAPIASAAIAGGQVSPAGLRMTVQHLEGGIVREILVDEGDKVEAGQPLIVFDATRAESNLEYDQTQLLRAEAMRARLEAHRAGAESIDVPQALIDAAGKDPEFAAFLAAQGSLFYGERMNLKTQLAIYEAQMRQLDAEIEGRKQEVTTSEEQLAIAIAELERIAPLMDSSLVQRSQMVELERLQSELRSRRSQATSLLAQAEQRLAQVRLNLSGAPEEFQRVVAEQLSNVNLQVAQLRERVRAGQDIVDRTVVRAPVAGTVVGLRVNTPNAVVGAGDPVLDIVPAETELVVNARLSPIDVDAVHVGLKVEVHVLSFVARNSLPLDGVVTKISADALADKVDGIPYYAVEIELNQSSILPADRDVLVSGMPVEVFIFTGSRTLLEYLTEPLLSSFRRSFRES